MEKSGLQQVKCDPVHPASRVGLPDHGPDRPVVYVWHRARAMKQLSLS